MTIDEPWDGEHATAVDGFHFPAEMGRRVRVRERGDESVLDPDVQLLRNFI
jgi:hypothetical protein